MEDAFISIAQGAYITDSDLAVYVKNTSLYRSQHDNTQKNYMVIGIFLSFWGDHQGSIDSIILNIANFNHWG